MVTQLEVLTPVPFMNLWGVSTVEPPARHLRDSGPYHFSFLIRSAIVVAKATANTAVIAELTNASQPSAVPMIPPAREIAINPTTVTAMSHARRFRRSAMQR